MTLATGDSTVKMHVSAVTVMVAVTQSLGFVSVNQDTPGNTVNKVSCNQVKVGNLQARRAEIVFPFDYFQKGIQAVYSSVCGKLYFARGSNFRSARQLN